MTFYARMPSPLGTMLLCSNGSHLSGVYFNGQSDCPSPDGASVSLPRSEDPCAGSMGGLPIKKFKAHRALHGDLFADAAPSRGQFDTPGHGSGGHTCDAADESAPGTALVLQADTPVHVRALFEQTQQELDAYFRSERRSFTVPLHVDGTDFQKKVWHALLAIPYGESASYADVARKAGLTAQHGRPTGVAVGRNPISIIIPCHRVLGGGGVLTGYTGGLGRKLALLQLEGFTIG